jgi:isopenicillin N synthase-like dioxygenase
MRSRVLIASCEVPNIDLSKYGTEEGNADLAETLIEAIRTKGFFYVTNFGISQEAVDRQFSLGQSFYELPLEEKLKYVPDLDSGDYNGYRPAGRRLLSGGVADKTEVWNMASKCLAICSKPQMLLYSVGICRQHANSICS